MDYTDVEGMSAEEKTLRLAWETEAPHMCFRDWLIAQVLRLREENAKLKDAGFELSRNYISLARELQSCKRENTEHMTAIFNLERAAAELGKEPPCQS